MKKIFCPILHNYNTRNERIANPIPRTVTYGLESFGYKANEIWNSLPKEIKSTNNIKDFKNLLFNKNPKLCSCNLCKVYVADLGYLNWFDNLRSRMNV